MDRIIEVKVGGNHLTKDSKYAGVRGEANVALLKITFDDSWDNFAKKVTFWDARGNNPVERTLTTDYLENISRSTRIYLIPIPAEPMAEAGKMTFVVDGYVDGKRQRSMSDQLEVKDSPIADNAGEPADPTPTQAEQLQSQIEGIIGTIAVASTSAEEAKTYSMQASEDAHMASRYKGEALGYRNEAQEYAEDAQTAAQKAEEALPHNPIIRDGYWHIWSIQTEEYINTGIKAQAGSEVYFGENPPETAAVLIDPNGESAIYAPYIGDNGNWYTFNPEIQTFTDSGNRAVAIDGNDGINGKDGISCTHSWNGTSLTVTSASGTSSSDLKGAKGDKGDTGAKGDKGDSYILTEADKTEIGTSVSAEIEAELNEALDAIIAIEEEFMTPDGDEVSY